MHIWIFFKLCRCLEQLEDKYLCLCTSTFLIAKTLAYFNFVSYQYHELCKILWVNRISTLKAFLSIFSRIKQGPCLKFDSVRAKSLHRQVWVLLYWFRSEILHNLIRFFPIGRDADWQVFNCGSAMAPLAPKITMTLISLD